MTTIRKLGPLCSKCGIGFMGTKCPHCHTYRPTFIAMVNETERREQEELQRLAMLAGEIC